MFNTPPANPASAKPRRAASSSGTPASSVNEKTRPRASTHWVRSVSRPGRVARCGASSPRQPSARGLYILWRVFFTRTGIHFARKRFGGDVQESPRLQLVTHHPLRDFAVARFWQRVPEEEAFWHFVARHFWRQERGKLRLAHRHGALTRHTDGDADFTPERVGHTQHGDLADRGMGEDLFLDLAWIDVGAAGNVHV